MQVALFITCLTDTFFPRVGVAVVRVLRHFRCEVAFPLEQTCCGQPFWNSGAAEEAAAVARRMVNVLSGFEAVVTPSASCAAFVRLRLPELLGGEAAARRVAERTWEFATFLEQRLGVDLGAITRLHEPTTFHFPCHARELCSVSDLRRWLGAGRTGHPAGEPAAADPAVTDPAATDPAAADPAASDTAAADTAGAVFLRPPGRPELCCGFGGAFAVEYPEISAGLLEDKLADLRATHADCVICNEGGCTLQLAGGARRSGAPLRFKHLAELLAESLGLQEAQP